MNYAENFRNNLSEIRHDLGDGLHHFRKIGDPVVCLDGRPIIRRQDANDPCPSAGYAVLC